MRLYWDYQDSFDFDEDLESLVDEAEEQTSKNVKVPCAEIDLVFDQLCCAVQQRRKTCPPHKLLSSKRYYALRSALNVKEDDPAMRIGMKSLLQCFPPLLRPFVWPIFIRWEFVPVSGERVTSKEVRLAKAEFLTQDVTIEWQDLVVDLSNFLNSGDMTWDRLIESADSEVSFDQKVLDERTAALLSILCFWCAHFDWACIADVGVGMSCPGLQKMKEALQFHNRSALLNNDIPHLPKAVKTLITHVLCDGPAPSPIQAPDSQILDPGLAFCIQGMTERLWSMPAWTPIYRDWCDGLSFRTMVKMSLQKGGPLVLVIKTTKGDIVGAVLSTMPNRCGSLAKDTGCLIFAMAPTLRVLRANPKSACHIYMNLHTSHNSRSRCGVGFGGKVGSHRLWLDDDLQNCYALSNDTAFDVGDILSGEKPHRFAIARMELWSCGTTRRRSSSSESRSSGRSSVESFSRQMSSTSTGTLSRQASEDSVG